MARSTVGVALTVRLIDEWWSWLPSGIVEDLHRELGFSYAQTGWLIALLFVGGVAGGPIAALSDRNAGRYRKPFAVTGGLGLCGGLLTYALGHSFTLFAVASLVLGMSSDVLIAPLEAGLADGETQDHASDGGRLDQLLGRQHALTFVGDLCGPALLAIAGGSSFGWRGAFLATAVVLAGFSVLVATVEFPAAPTAATQPGEANAPDEGVAGDEGDEGDEGQGGLRTIVRRSDVWKLVLVELLLGPLDEPLLAFVVARAAQRAAGAGTPVGAGGPSAQLIAAGVTVGGLAGSLAVARSGLQPRLRSVGPCLIVAGTVGAVLAAPIAFTIVAMTAAGTGLALLWAGLHHRLLSVVPGRAATVSALVGTASTAGAIVPVGAGIAADRFGLTAALVIYVAIAAATIPASALALGPARTRRPDRRASPPDGG